MLSSDTLRLAKRLARLLGADPLGQAAEWERSLDDDGLEDGRAVLIR